MSLSSANVVTAKQLRDGLGSVFILGLTADSPARTIAQQAVGATSSYLRGKDAFASAYQALLALPGSNTGGQLCLNSAQGVPTRAGSIVAAWQKAKADRTTLFENMGATGPSILVVQINGIDETALWQEDASGHPRIVTGAPGASLA